MTHKSKTQPLCRCCGKPIKKATRTHWIEQREESSNPVYKNPNDHITYHWLGERMIFTKEECQALTNESVVSITKSRYANDTPGETNPARIRQFTTWDGESYASGLFCSGTCAQTFGIMAATNHPNIQTKAYAEAMRFRADLLKRMNPDANAKQG